MEQLTVQQAKELGYEFYGYTGEGYQIMNNISDPPTRWTGSERLFNKDPEPPFVTLAEDIKDMIIDRVSSDWVDQSHDDTGEMYDFLNDIPLEKFEGITEVINEAAANKHYYKLAKIQLIP